MINTLMVLKQGIDSMALEKLEISVFSVSLW